MWLLKDMYSVIYVDVINVLKERIATKAIIEHNSYILSITHES